MLLNANWPATFPPVAPGHAFQSNGYDRRLGIDALPAIQFFEVAGSILQNQYELAFSRGKIISKSQGRYLISFNLTALEVVRLFKRIESGQIDLTVRHGTLSEAMEIISKTFKSLTTSIVLTLYMIAAGLYLLAETFWVSAVFR